jgi:hypothetical protein
VELDAARVLLVPAGNRDHDRTVRHRPAAIGEPVPALDEVLARRRLRHVDGPGLPREPEILIATSAAEPLSR